MASDELHAILKHEVRGPCAVCGEEGQACARCRVDFYCGKAHQRLDWPRHKQGCGALELRQGWLVAAKDVPAGTRILREVPAVVMPRQDVVDGFMMCRGCCAELGPAPSESAAREAAELIAAMDEEGEDVVDVDWGRCEDCGLPLCEADCDHDGRHRGECKLLQRGGFKLKETEMHLVSQIMTMGLAVLRTYLWAREHPQLETRFCGTVNEVDLEGETQLATQWRGARDWLRDAAGLHWLPEEGLRKAYLLAKRCATVVFGDHDRYQLGHREDCQACRGRGVQALYAGHCLIANSCLANVFSVTLDACSLESVLVASRDLRRGEPLYLDHRDDPLQSAAERRHAARQMGLRCACAACNDPARLGLHLDSWRCQRCPGLMVPVPPGPQLAEPSVARCSGCGREAAAPDAEVEAAREELERLEERRRDPDGPAVWEAYLRRHLRGSKGPLHPNHVFALRAKRWALRGVQATLCRANRKHTIEELRRWEQMGRDLLRALDVLRPGYGPHRSNVMLAMNTVLVILAVHLDEVNKPRREVQALMDEAKEQLRMLDVTLISKEEREAYRSLSSTYNIMRVHLTM